MAKKKTAAPKKEPSTEQRWTKFAADRLVGRTIKSVSYMTDEERELQGWYQKPLVIELDDGSVLFPISDDEGNGPGSLVFFNNAGDNAGEALIPVIR